ncbi:hypothetical protein PTSG_09933 [Salpingoeca rosetta]|uniref:Uncharacterized protein n=1 Tax=Salpingoeca rosetta (strain ATCC 50818 / BSB-021) TaxID=946362 RepID=F2UNJ9_SALR5|nr:uncharacterized protein PTSG_09933 [Salpingoeca rosetta]EGD79204.1 hypothetical protein PTSG_09933 [Salpingoeca rosetta]|eukprot:XP_004989289.1 hypothetical protein PTSG_09933 [Salpingoeca rosetta]
MGVAKSNECDVNTAPPAAAFKTLLLTGTSLIALPDMIGCLDNIRCSWDGVWGGQDPVPPDLRQQMTKLAHLEQRVRSSIGNQVVRQTSRNAKGGGVPDVVKKAVDYLPRMEKQLDDIQLHDILSSDIVASVDTANPDEDACHRIILWRYKLARFKPPTEALNAARWLLCSAGSASELAHRLSYFSVAVNRQMQEEYEQHARAGNADALFAYRDLRNNGRSTLDQRCAHHAVVVAVMVVGTSSVCRILENAPALMRIGKRMTRGSRLHILHCRKCPSLHCRKCRQDHVLRSACRILENAPASMRIGKRMTRGIHGATASPVQLLPHSLQQMAGKMACVVMSQSTAPPPRYGSHRPTMTSSTSSSYHHSNALILKP